jgi:hypothetical protein
MLVVLKVD